MQKELSASATVVGVNGDFFAANPGKPSGILMRGGALDSAPLSSRSSLGIGADGLLTVAGLVRRHLARQRTAPSARPERGAGAGAYDALHVGLGAGDARPRAASSSTCSGSLPPLTPNGVAHRASSRRWRGTAGCADPAGRRRARRAGRTGAASDRRGTGRRNRRASSDAHAQLERNGERDRRRTGARLRRQARVPGARVFRRSGAQHAHRAQRRRQLSDGRVLLVTAEGGSLAYSAGMTNYELAVALVRLGARTAMGLGSGTSAAMAFDGTLLTRPAGGEQPVSDALLLSYTGLYAAPPASATLSPNGDGVDDVQTFSYKLVRASQVTATVVGPDRSTRTLVQDGEQPGVHTLQWDGSTTTGAAAARAAGSSASPPSTIAVSRRPPTGSSRSTTRSARWHRAAAAQLRPEGARRRRGDVRPRARGARDRHGGEAERHRDRDRARRAARPRGAEGALERAHVDRLARVHRRVPAARRRDELDRHRLAHRAVHRPPL